MTTTHTKDNAMIFIPLAAVKMAYSINGKVQFNDSGKVWVDLFVG